MTKELLKPEETPARKQLKRVRVKLPEESPARRAGLFRIQAEREGFRCACGTHQELSSYILAHWSEMLQWTCKACGRVFKVKAGAMQQISGPVKKPTKIKHEAPGHMIDPNKPFWRAYHVLNNGARGTVFKAASDYHETLDAANNQAWDYTDRVHPHSRERRDDLFRSLIRKEEFPLLSAIITDGLAVGGGHLQATGSGLDEMRQSPIIFFELRDPKGRVTRVEMLAEVWKEIAADLEYRPMTPAEALAQIKKED